LINELVTQEMKMLDRTTKCWRQCAMFRMKKF